MNFILQIHKKINTASGTVRIVVIQYLGKFNFPNEWHVNWKEKKTTLTWYKCDISSEKYLFFVWDLPENVGLNKYCDSSVVRVKPTI